MSNDELLDLVDENDQVIGTVWKSEAHQNPKLLHREVAIAVFNKKGQVLLQQRSMKKTNDPGEWKMTAAGHIGAGEDPEVAVKREVFEELGIKIKPVYFKKHFHTYKDKEARFFWVYYAIVTKNPTLKLDEEEVMDAKWVDVRYLEKFSKRNTYSLDSTSHKTICEIAKKLEI